MFLHCKHAASNENLNIDTCWEFPMNMFLIKNTLFFLYLDNIT